jgi:hypothetical protein
MNASTIAAGIIHRQRGDDEVGVWVGCGFGVWVGFGFGVGGTDFFGGPGRVAVIE